MYKVMEFLNENLYAKTDSTYELKSNGHYGVFGDWEYPKGISESENIRIKEHMKTDPTLSKWVSKNRINLSINNETLNINGVIINGENAGIYGYLQTYEHIPRHGPDVNGYYSRSTDEEIINYLESRLIYFEEYSYKKRRDKINKIKSIINENIKKN